MKKSVILILSIVLLGTNVYAFKSTAVLNITGDIAGSTTLPSIDDTDLAKLGANYMDGMTGFVVTGMLEAGYIFGSEKYMGMKNDKIFGGIGVFGYLGVGDGYAGQISGAAVGEEQVDVFFNIYYSPVLSAGAIVKFYFFKNRLAIGLGGGVKIIADTQPSYEMYSTEDSLFPATVGTIIVDDFMMENANAFMGSMKITIEYNIPVLNTLEVIFGGYFAYNIYQPLYITMPPALLTAAIENSGLDPQEPIESYYINSMEYGIRVGLGFRL